MLTDNRVHASVPCDACDACDACDEANNTSVSKENNSNDIHNDIFKNESISHTSHIAHSSSNHIEESDTTTK